LVRVVVGFLKLPHNVVLVEADNGIELLFKSSEGSAFINYSPQKKIEEILRDYESDYIESLEEALPSEEVGAELRMRLYSAYESEEIIELVKGALNGFAPLLSRVSKIEQRVLQEARGKRVKVERDIANQREKVEQCKVLYRRANELQTLWNHIVDYFDSNGTLSDIKNDDRYKELATDLDIPKALLNKVYKREDKSDSPDPSLEPLKLAIEHTCHLLGIKVKHDSHVKYYYIGRGLVGDDEWLAPPVGHPS
jgi:hypothetical protein